MNAKLLCTGLLLVAACGVLGAEVPAVSGSGELRSNIQYGEATGEKLLLDVNIPAGEGTFPVVILVHGGGWGSGDKEGDLAPALGPAMTGSFTWFTINYRLAPKYQWPACFEDVQTAIRWVKAHAAEYKGDPSRIALIGYSAGGNLACLAAVRADADTRVQAVVGCAPPTDIPADIQRRGNLLSKSLQALFGHSPAVDAGTMKSMVEMSAIDYIYPGMPPFLLIHGTADQSVPYNQSINFKAKLEANKVPCQLITLQGATHKIADWDKFDPTYQDQIIAWLEQTLSK
jgi:alpha-L-fucosidase 2